jgi:hypothetical protein
VPSPLPADPKELLRALDADAIDAWLDSLDVAEMTRRVLDLDAQIRSWKTLIRTVRARQRWRRRKEMVPPLALAGGDDHAA